MKTFTFEKKTITKKKDFVDFAGRSKAIWKACNDHLNVLRDDHGIGEIFGDDYKAIIEASKSTNLDYDLLAENISIIFNVACSKEHAERLIKLSKTTKSSRHRVTFTKTKK
jgi:hypothetical protein